MRNRIRIVTFCRSGRIICWLRFIACGPCMPIWLICMLWRTKKLRMATKKYPYSSAHMPMAMYAIGEEKYDFSSLCAIARMLLMGHLFSGHRLRLGVQRWRRRRDFFGGQREE